MKLPINSILEKFADAQQMSQHFLENRQIFLWGYINDNNARRVVDALLYLQAKDTEKPISLYINSESGTFTAAMVIIDTINLLKTPVHIIGMGLVSSAGALILSTGNKRYLYPNVQVKMQTPEMSSAFQGRIATGRNSSNHIQRLQNLVANLYAKNCQQTVEKIKADFNEDRWLMAEEAISYGIADEVVQEA